MNKERKVIGRELSNINNALDMATDHADELKEKLNKILQWAEAYPIDAFPEPDFKKAAIVLKDNGMTLDAISASNMRHVLNGIKDIIGT